MLFTLTALDPTPDTSVYMIAGYTVIFSFMLIYLVSLLIRTSKTKKEYEVLEELDKKE